MAVCAAKLRFAGGSLLSATKLVALGNVERMFENDAFQFNQAND